MTFQTNIILATCTAISTIPSSYTATTQGLLPVMLFKLTIIIIIIFIIIVLLSCSVTWIERTFFYPKEITPRFPVGGGGNDDDFWTKFKKKIKRLFART